MNQIHFGIKAVMWQNVEQDKRYKFFLNAL